MNEIYRRLKSKYIQFITVLTLIVLPFVLGVIGYLKALDCGVINAMYHALRIYSLEIDVEDYNLNLYIQIGRWLAVFAVFSIFISLLSKVFKSIRVYSYVRNNNTIGLHGDPELLSYLKADRNYRFIEEREYGNFMSFLPKKQLFLFEDEKNLMNCIAENEHILRGAGGILTTDPLAESEGNRQYAKKELKQLKNRKQLYLCTDTFASNIFYFPNATIINLAEHCARIFWEKYFMRKDESCFVMIGFDTYGQKLLTQALLINVRDVVSNVVYHIFPINEHERQKANEFLAIHTELDKFVDINQNNGNRDAVIFHKEPFYENKTLLSVADRVIIAGNRDAENLEILSTVMEMNLLEKIYLRISNAAMLQCIWPTVDENTLWMNTDMTKSDVNDKGARKEHLVIFGMMEQICSAEAIFKDELMKVAQLCHARWKYQDSVASVDFVHFLEEEIQTPAFKREWHQLSVFLKYSNVTQADHISTKVRILFGDEVDVNSPYIGTRFIEAYQALSNDEKERLSEIEHLRWLRYYYLNNWIYGEKRNVFLRKHEDLMPYDKLSREEQLKDADTFAIGAYLNIRSKSLHK